MQALVFNPRLSRLAANHIMSRILGKLYLGPGSALRLLNVDTPAISEPEDVLVRCRLAGICGSDLQIIGIRASPSCSVLARNDKKQKTNLFLGHEVVGEVCDLGKNVVDLKIGDRVVLSNDLSCIGLNVTPCIFCAEKFPATFCINRNAYVGRQVRGGGWSEYMLVHRHQLELIGDELADEVAVLIEPLSTALNAVGRYCAPQQSQVLIVGCGTMGLAVIATLRATGRTDLNIVAIGLHKRQREMALSLGADVVLGVENEYEELAKVLGSRLLGKKSNRILETGFHVAYDCVGNADTINKVLRWLRPKGQLILVGFNLYPSKIDCSPIFHRQIDVRGAHGYGSWTTETETITTVNTVITHLKSGRLGVEQMLTDVYPLKEYRQAIAAAENKKGGAIKVALDMR